jgi:hypothetical protein
MRPLGKKAMDTGIVNVTPGTALSAAKLGGRTGRAAAG